MARGINMAFKSFTQQNMPVPGSVIRGGPGEGDWTGVNPLTGQRERIYMTPSGDLPGEQGWESDNPNSTEGWLLQGGVKDTGNDWFDNLVIGGIGAIAGQGLWGALSPAAGAADAASVGYGSAAPAFDVPWGVNPPFKGNLFNQIESVLWSNPAGGSMEIGRA